MYIPFQLTFFCFEGRKNCVEFSIQIFKVRLVRKEKLEILN